MTVMADPKDYVVSVGASIEDVDLDREEIYFRGARLTEDRAERIAETALRDARRRGLIPGRKSLSGGNTHSPRLEVRVPADLHREIAARAKRENVAATSSSLLKTRSQARRTWQTRCGPSVPPSLLAGRGR